MHNVALIAPFGWAGISVPLVMSVEYLSSNGYSVDIYFDRNEACHGMGLNEPLFDFENVNIYFYDFRGIDSLEKYLDLNILKKEIDFIDFIKSNGRDYDFLIGYDEDGLIRAGMYGLERNIPFYYHSLEFYEKEDDKKIAERFFANKANRIFTQDKYRAEILSKMLNVSIDKFSIVYNSSIGEPINEKSNFFRDKFNIDKDKKIVLATGSLMSITGIDKILDTVKDWNDAFVLVLHGWLPEKKIEELIDKFIKEYGNKIYYSSDIVQHKDKFEIFSSADICLVYYEPINLNLKYAAWSSGKFFDSARCGVPLIANKLPNMDKLVEDNGCGLVIDDFNELQGALEKIMSDYETYKENCYRTYLKYSFYSSFEKAMREGVQNER